MKDNNRIALLLTVVIISLPFSTSIAAAVTDTVEGNTTENEIGSDTGTQGVENNYVAVDSDIDGSGPLRQSGLIFIVPLNKSDTIEVTATTNDPADFISCDSNFMTSYMINNGVVRYGSGDVYQSESYSKANTYYLKKPMDRTNYYLIIRDSAGNDLNVRGHVKIVVYSKFSPAFEPQ